MSKVLFFLLAGIALYAFLRWQKRVGNAKRSSAQRPPPVAELMVACSHCGLNIPKSEALTQGARHYCSEDHRDRGAR